MTPVRVTALFPPTAIHVDLYFAESDFGGQPRLYTRADAPPTQRDLQALQNSGVSTLYTTAAEAIGLHEQFHAMLHSGISMRPEVHFEVARESARGELARAWTNKQADELVNQAAEFADVILDVCNSDLAASSLIDSVLKHDGDTFTHVSNVCVYTVMLLKQLGVSDSRPLAELGQAALLHDLGKRFIQKDLLKKAGVLSAQEREVISQHPRMGFQEVCGRDDLNRDQLLMVYHHHEKLDGTGYPVGLCGEEIHWTGRLCAVVDVFDALTGRRPYRKSATATEAISYLQQNAAAHFDPEFVRCWSSLVSEKSK